jgi:acyl-CoA synthetase (AMP-forming)/AMP-acid ligase II
LSVFDQLEKRIRIVMDITDQSKGCDGLKKEIASRWLPSSCKESFSNLGSLFLRYYTSCGSGDIQYRDLTRGDFLDMTLRAAGILADSGLREGDRFLCGFGANDPADMAFRLAAAITKTTPVTINWQGDTPERAAYKASLSLSKLLIADDLISETLVKAVTGKSTNIPVLYTRDILDWQIPEVIALPENIKPDDEKIIIFTSGTTGNPKGVILTWENYDTNAATFRDIFPLQTGKTMDLVMTNPLHHANSSALSDWFLREPGAVIHILPRYATSYWEILTAIAEKSEGLVLAPCVSRHFDFLEELDSRGQLPVDKMRLRKALGRVSFLMGSAPVGPTTVGRVTDWTGRPPIVRFGSTETCLQVLGTPAGLDGQVVMDSFKAGWQRTPSPGYYIGRPHLPHTEARVVKSVTPDEPGFMETCLPGEDGYLIARGKNLMKGYLGNPGATIEVLYEGWYLGFGDICFFLENSYDGERDFYWLGRESGLLIKGGANYSCEQVAAELSSFISERYGLEAGSFDLAVIGLHLDSEHEDTCCVTIDDSGLDSETRQRIRDTFLDEARGSVSKGARPGRVDFGPIPRTFKGSLDTSELRNRWERIRQ